MAALCVLRHAGERPVRPRLSTTASDKKLAGLSKLATVDIETPLVADLSGTLHAIFDPVSEGALPIYFGPLLGRLYLEGL